MKYKFSSNLYDLKNRIFTYVNDSLGQTRNDQLRILCMAAKYPQYSETYMHEEMSSLSAEFNLKIFSYVGSSCPRENHLPYTIVQYNDACINWSDFNLVNTKFNNRKQVEYLGMMGKEIRKFRPDILHGHYFATGLLISKLAEIYNIPFTLRTHSFDVLQLDDKPEKADALFNAISSPLCMGVFVYPEFRDMFLRHGIPDNKILVSWPVVNVDRFYNPEKPVAAKRILCCGPCTDKKAHDQYIDFAYRMKGSEYTFDLYTRGDAENRIRKYNQQKDSPVKILYADPEDMPGVYRAHDWLIYPTDIRINDVGLPCSIIEAQASGIGICWQEIPGRRQSQMDFLGGAGFLFKSFEDIPGIINRDYPEEMRMQGYENAWKCDVKLHREKVSSLWNNIVQAEHSSVAV